ncbi:hypothetical protein Ocin01_07117 [Orchesella cincta]|uniref:Uncharacterized protein n=1 Tax=Orchesella cincta TaxID=48709 RepID=A0A1D2N2U5_ORCCI|nr:hypothetical protein Ocin01_07117 [Orchesella cincta]
MVKILCKHQLPVSSVGIFPCAELRHLESRFSSKTTFVNSYEFLAVVKMIHKMEVEEPMSQSESTSQGASTSTLPETSTSVAPQSRQGKRVKAVAGKRKSQRLASGNRRRSKSKAQADGTNGDSPNSSAEAGEPSTKPTIQKRPRSKSTAISVSKQANKRVKPSVTQKRRKKPSGERRRKKEAIWERRRRKPVASEKKEPRRCPRKEARRRPLPNVVASQPFQRKGPPRSLQLIAVVNLQFPRKEARRPLEYSDVQRQVRNLLQFDDQQELENRRSRLSNDQKERKGYFIY